MKKALLLGAALMFIASGASAQMIGLFVDANHADWNVDMPSGVAYVYVFASPTAEGMTCLELATVADNANFMAFATAWAPDAAEARMGNIPNENLVGCWTSCKFEWTWLCNAGLFMMSGDPLTVTPVPYSGQPFMKVLDCSTPAVEQEGIPYSEVCINHPVPCPLLITAVEESSWGAIKNLYE